MSAGAADGYPDSYRHIVRRLDELIEMHADRPVYSKDLADHAQVSIRTLQSATLAVSNMSLHGYVRWRRLLAVRAKLRRGNTSVKTAAMQCGFWHLGDFSRSYRKEFGELPSATLASAQSR